MRLHIARARTNIDESPVPAKPAWYSKINDVIRELEALPALSSIAAAGRMKRIAQAPKSQQLWFSRTNCGASRSN